ncbi:MAG: TolC family protein [Syntrophomonadaceae bacterium]|nr:TolC family protein [Syntrophomonadaceae bacterium]
MKKTKVLAIVLTLFISMSIPAAARADSSDAGTAGQAGLTIQQAIDMALKNSSSIKMNDYNIKSAEITLDDASDAVTYMPTGQADESVISAVTALESANISWNMANKSKDTEEDKTVYTVFKDYTGVLQALENLQYAEQAMSNARWQILMASNTHQVGMISQYQMDQAELQHQTAQNSLTNAQVALDSAYHSLNQDIGLQPDERPSLAEQPAYSKLVVDDVEAYAHRITESSPSIWQADSQISVAKIQLDLSAYANTTGNGYQTRKLAIDKAELSASSARDSMEQAVRTLYSSILNLENTYDLQLQALQQTEATLEVTKLKYDLGMATKDDVQTAQLNLSNDRKSLNSTIYQHEQLKLAFEKPWAY